MAINKVEYGNQVLVDLTEDTITADHLWAGYTAHDKTGEQIIGQLKAVPMVPIEYDYNIGYIATGTWVYENPTQTYTDIYEVQAGRRYFITLGGNVGSRFRCMFTTTDIRTVTSGRIAGTQIVNLNNPAAYSNASFTTTEDGFILVAKDNVGKTGIFSYVYDAVDSWA